MFQRLLDSVLMQSYRDYEIIVSDDSQNNAIAKVLEQYNDERIRYYHNEIPFGTPENWNNAIRHAHGDYIKIMHHDDWFISVDALKLMVDAIESSDADFVWCASNNYENGEVTRVNQSTEQQLTALREDVFVLFSGNFISAPSTMICKRTTLEYDRNLKWYVDIEYYTHLLRNGKFTYIDNPLVGINNDKGRVTDQCITNYEVIYSEYFYCWEKFRKLKILTPIKSYYWLYKFLRLHKPSQWGEVQPYCTHHKIMIYFVYTLFWLKLAIDKRSTYK